MTHRPLCGALALCACLVLAAPAWGAEEEPAPLPPSAPEADAAAASAAAARAEAKALLEAGRFGEAVTILGPLVQGAAIEANDLFLYGLAAAGAPT